MARALGQYGLLLEGVELGLRKGKAGFQLCILALKRPSPLQLDGQFRILNEKGRDEISSKLLRDRWRCRQEVIVVEA